MVRLGGTFLVDPGSLVNNLKTLGYVRELQRLLAAQAKKAAIVETIGKEVHDLILQRFVKIDQHITTKDQMHFAENAIRYQVVVGKGNITL